MSSSLSVPPTPLGSYPTDLSNDTSSVFRSDFHRLDTSMMRLDDDTSHPVRLLTSTPSLLEQQQQHEAKRANEEDEYEHDVNANTNANDEDSNDDEGEEDQTRKMPRVVEALVVPAPDPAVEAITRAKRKTTAASSMAASSSSSSAVHRPRPLHKRVMCKGGCGRPPVPSILCIKCQLVTCAACAVTAAPCPVGPHHVHMRVDYISEMLRSVVSDSKQVDVWGMTCIQDMVGRLEREHHVRVWFNPEWNGSVEQHAELLLVIYKLTMVPIADRQPARYLSVDPNPSIVLRTASEPAHVEAPNTMLVLVVTFPDQGCFSLIQMNRHPVNA